MFQHESNLFDCIREGRANNLVNSNRSEMESAHSPLGRIVYSRANPCNIGYKYTKHGLMEYIKSVNTERRMHDRSIIDNCTNFVLGNTKKRNYLCENWMKQTTCILQISKLFMPEWSAYKGKFDAEDFVCETMELDLPWWSIKKLNLSLVFFHIFFCQAFRLSENLWQNLNESH